MARRRTVKRRERRQGSRGWLVKVGVALVLLLPVLYFVFTKVFFDPFEGTQPPFTALVPRDVDLFVHREALATDIESFPEPRFAARLRRTRAFKELEKSAWWQSLAWPKEYDAMLASTRQSLAASPLDPLADVLGREVAVVGRLPQPGAGQPGTGDAGAGVAAAGEAQYALMARLSDKAKLAIELLDSEAALQRSLPGATLTVVEDADVPGLTWRRLDLPADGSAGASGTWYYARRQDLLIAGRSEVFVRDLLRAAEAGAESSIGLSNLWHDELPRAAGAPEERFSAAFQVDLPKLLARLQSGGSIDEKHPDALRNALSALVDPRLFGDVVGRLEVDDAVTLRAHGDLAAPDVAVARAGLVGAPTFRAGERLAAMAGMLPQDMSAVVSMNVEIRPLLQTLVESLGPDELELLNGSIRDLARYSPAWKVDNVAGLVGYLSRVLGDEVTLAFRPLDHQIPKGSQPIPLLAVVLHVKDLSLWNEFDDVVVRGSKALGVPDDKRFKVDEGVGVRKWLGVVNLPMNEIAYIVLDPDVPGNSGTAVIATDNDLLREIVSIYTNSRSALATKTSVRAAIAAFGDARANLVAWVSPESLLKVLAPYAEWIATDATRIDFVPLRLRKRKELLAGPEYAAYRGQEDNLPEEVQKQLDERLDAILEAQEQTRLTEEVPRLAAEWLAGKQWLTLVSSAGLALRLGERNADVVLDVRTVLGD
jgi:hypothetical protein